jgi:hypothetical protein
MTSDSAGIECEIRRFSEVIERNDHKRSVNGRSR